MPQQQHISLSLCTQLYRHMWEVMMFIIALDHYIVCQYSMLEGGQSALCQHVTHTRSFTSQSVCLCDAASVSSLPVV